MRLLRQGLGVKLLGRRRSHRYMPFPPGSADAEPPGGRLGLPVNDCRGEERQDKKSPEETESRVTEILRIEKTKADLG